MYSQSPCYNHYRFVLEKKFINNHSITTHNLCQYKILSAFMYLVIRLIDIIFIHRKNRKLCRKLTHKIRSVFL